MLSTVYHVLTCVHDRATRLGGFVRLVAEGQERRLRVLNRSSSPLEACRNRGRYTAALRVNRTEFGNCHVHVGEDMTDSMMAAYTFTTSQAPGVSRRRAPEQRLLN